MNKKRFLLSTGLVISISAIAISLISISLRNNLKEVSGADDYYTITLTPDTFTALDDTTWNSGTVNTVTDQLGNAISLNYTNLKKDANGVLLNNTSEICNSIGNEIRGMKSVTINADINTMFYCQWGYKNGSSIEYTDEKWNSPFSSGKYEISFNDDRPNYLSIKLGQSEDAYFSSIVIKYDVECEETPYPIYDINGIRYKKHKGYVEVVGFSSTAFANVTIEDTVAGLPVTKIGNNAFTWSSIKSITLGSNVVTIAANAFMYSGLETINSLSQLETIEMQAFANASLSGTVTFGDNLVSIASGAFSSNSGITNIVFSDVPSATVNSNAFDNCSGVITCHVGSNMTVAYPDLGQSYNMLSYSVGSGNTKYEAINGAIYFHESTYLVGGRLPKGLTSYVAPNDSRIKKLSGSFARQSKVVTVDLGDYITTLMSQTFMSCTDLETITFSPTLERLNGSDFFLCTKLEQVDFTSTALNYIGSSSFYGCSLLNTVKLPTSLRTISYGAFDSCPLLTSLSYAGEISAWNSNVHLESGWQYGSSITSIVCSDGTITL